MIRFLMSCASKTCPLETPTFIPCPLTSPLLLTPFLQTLALSSSLAAGPLLCLDYQSKCSFSIFIGTVVTTWFSNTNLLTLSNKKRKMNRIAKYWIQAILMSCQNPGRYLKITLRWTLFAIEQLLMQKSSNTILRNSCNTSLKTLIMVGKYARCKCIIEYHPIQGKEIEILSVRGVSITFSISGCHWCNWRPCLKVKITKRVSL